MKRKTKEGDSYNLTNNQVATIIKYYSYKNVSIQFEDGTILHNISVGELKIGKVKNPNSKTLLGVGCFGQGTYKSRVNGKSTKEYSAWTAMLQRCYNKKHQEIQPTYKGCSVTEEWHNFQNFAEWFTNNYIEGFQLDKDILLKGNKVYSPNMCSFVPHEINSLFTKSNSIRGKLPIGVKNDKGRFVAGIKKGKKNHHIGSYNTPEEAFEAYKTEKEKYIKEVADKYKNQITDKVYQALYDYKVEITD